MNSSPQKDKSTFSAFRIWQILRNSCLVFMALGLPISGCAQTKPELVLVPAKQQAVSAPKPKATSPEASGVPERMSFEQKYAVEIAMGADCPKAHLGSGWGGVISDGACTAQLPSYFTPMMEMLSAQSATLLHQTANQDIFKPVDNKFYIRAVPGFGARPDILVRLAGDAWIRSFEGTDPTITMYLVRAHFACNAHERRTAKKNGRFAMQLCDDLAVRAYELREDDPGLRLRLYRVKGNGAPEDVTATLLPPLPSISLAERKRYYQYSDKGHNDNERAVLPYDTSLVTWTGILQYAPTLRWWLDLSPDYSLPESDPRWLGTRAAHFGFLIWTGKKFEMRQQVPRSFVPCAVLDSGAIRKCIPHSDPYAQVDRFIIEDK